MKITYPPSSGTVSDGSVTNAKLAAGAVTTGKIAAGSITGSKIAAGALLILGFQGLAASGDVSLGVTAGDTVIQVLDGDGFPYGASFDTEILASGVLRQSENSDFSEKRFVAYVLSRTP